MSILNKSAILAASDIQTADVDVPEWGGTVRVRTISVAERFKANAAAMEATKTNNDPLLFSVYLCAACMVDESGSGEAWTAEDITALMQRANGPFERVFEAASKLNGFGGSSGN